MMENKEEIKYAGFWVRVLAAIIDGLILYIPVTLIEALFGEDSWMSIVFVIVLWWQYTAQMLSSSWRATVGKKVVGLEVLDTNLAQLTFREASFRFLYSFISYSFILPIFMMFFNDKKQTFHDYFAKTIVVDVSSMLKNAPRSISIEEVNLKKDVDIEDTRYQNNKIKRIGIIGFIRTVGIIVVIGFGAYYLYVFGMTVYVFGSLAKHKQRSYDNSFQIEYKTNDYNDSRITFYKKELEKHSKEFIEADGMYNIFEADVKKDLALNCIEHFLREHNETDWIDQGSGFRKNARNKYASTEEKIEKAKKNEDYMGRHFYTFDLNMVNHIEDEITKVWSDKNDSICENKLPANELYEIFIKKYIPKFDDENIHSRFGSKPQQREIDWFNILMKAHPEYLKKKKEEERLLQIQYQEIKRKEVKAEKERQEKLYQDALKRYKQPIFAAIQFKKNSDFDRLMAQGIDIETKNKQGYTLLRAAVFDKNEYVINRLLDSGANMYAMDKHNLYSPFTWAVSDNDIEIIKLFLEHGVDVNYQYKKSETALTIAAKGCKNFELVELLLDNGANPKLMDTYGQNTISGLSRYCRDKNSYKKMMKLIEKKSSFFGKLFSNKS